MSVCDPERVFVCELSVLCFPARIFIIFVINRLYF